MYIVLSDWMSIAGNSSSIEIFADEIIPLTILNIEFLKPPISLKVCYCFLLFFYVPIIIIVAIVTENFLFW